MLQEKPTYSQSYLTKLVQGVGLLLDFINANWTSFDDPTQLFAVFVERLYTGTIGLNGDDPSGLYWHARSPKLVRQLVGQLSDFSDWLEEEQVGTSLNPWRKARRAEERLAWAAWSYRKNRSILKHTMGQDNARLQASRARAQVLRRMPIVDHEAVKYFPDHRIEDLLFKGFIVPGKQCSPRIEERLNLRNILITMLMHFGGLRMSEAFHIYVHDVIPDPLEAGSCVVRVYHPSLGAAPDDWLGSNGEPVRCNRANYLRAKWAHKPRNEYACTTGMYSGWKGNVLDSKAHFMDVYWFPTWAGKLFWKLWIVYLSQRTQLACNHPFAFVKADGSPYSISAFKQAHRLAIERIGMKPAKAQGTTPHAHRHAYGRRLADANIDPSFRKKALHHRSLESQILYTEPDRRKLLRAIQEAEKRVLSSGTPSPLTPPNLLAHGFEDVDPMGLFSGIQKLSV